MRNELPAKRGKEWKENLYSEKICKFEIEFNNIAPLLHFPSKGVSAIPTDFVVRPVG